MTTGQQSVDERHEQAMAVADEAMAAQRRGAADKARELFGKALALELAALEAFLHKSNAEPTRSILLRSAVSLAVDAGDHEGARRVLEMARGDNGMSSSQAIEDRLEQLARMMQSDADAVLEASSSLRQAMRENASASRTVST